MTYSLEYGRTDTVSIRQELASLLHGAGTKVDCARLLAVMSGIAATGADGTEENFHAQIGQRTLHAVALARGICAFYYADGVEQSRTIYLLWCGLDSEHLLEFPTAANRILGAY